jgi:PST family polysaccharide transporter
LFSPLSTLGLQLIVIREIKKHPDQQNKIISSAVAIRFVGAVTALVAIIAIANVLAPKQSIVIILAGLVFLAQSPQSIRFLFEEKLQISRLVLISSTIITIGYIAKIVYLFYYNNIKILLLIDIVTAIFISVWFMYAAKIGFYRLISHVDYANMRKIFLSALPIALSSAAIIIFSKSDQLMIGYMLSFSDNGQYALASTFISALYFIPTALSQVLYPRVLSISINSEDKLNIFMQKKIEVMLVVIVPILIVMYIIFPVYVNAIGKEGFSSSVSCFNIMMWSLLSVTLGVASNKWLIANNLQRLAFYRTLAAAVINIILNFVFIPAFGINGAAFASVLAHLFSGYIGNCLTKQTRPLFLLQTRAIKLSATRSLLRNRSADR